MPLLTIDSLLALLQDQPMKDTAKSRAKTALYLLARHTMVMLGDTQATARPLGEVRKAIVEEHLDASEYLVLGRGESVPKQLLDAVAETAMAIARAKGGKPRRAAVVARTQARELFEVLVMCGVVPGPAEVHSHPTLWPSTLERLIAHSANSYGSPAYLRTLLRCLRDASSREDLTPENAADVEWKRAFAVLERWSKDGTVTASHASQVRSLYRRLYALRVLPTNAPFLKSAIRRNVWSNRHSRLAARGDRSGIRTRCPGLADGEYGVAPYIVAYRGSDEEKRVLGLPRDPTVLLVEGSHLDRRPSTVHLSVATMALHLNVPARLATFAHRRGLIGDTKTIDLRHLILATDGYGVTDGQDRRSILDEWAKQVPSPDPGSVEEATGKDRSAAGVYRVMANIAAPCLANVATAHGDHNLAADLVRASNRYSIEAKRLGLKPFESDTAKMAKASAAWVSAGTAKASLIPRLGAVMTFLEEQLLRITQTDRLERVVARLRSGSLRIDETIDELSEALMVLQLDVCLALRPEEIERLQHASVRDTMVDIGVQFRKNWKPLKLPIPLLSRERYASPLRGTDWDPRIRNLWDVVRAHRLSGRESSFFMVPKDCSGTWADSVRENRQGIVFPIGTGPHLRPSTLRPVTRRIIKAIQDHHNLNAPSEPAGPDLPAPGWGLYIVRHCVATGLLALGHSMKEVSDLLGNTERVCAMCYDARTAMDHDYRSRLHREMERHTSDANDEGFVEEIRFMVACGMTPDQAGAIVERIRRPGGPLPPSMAAGPRLRADGSKDRRNGAAGVDFLTRQTPG